MKLRAIVSLAIRRNVYLVITRESEYVNILKRAKGGRKLISIIINILSESREIYTSEP